MKTTFDDDDSGISSELMAEVEDAMRHAWSNSLRPSVAEVVVLLVLAAVALIALGIVLL